MHTGCSLLVRRAEADGRAAGDQCRLVALAGQMNGFLDLFGVMAVNRVEVPARRFEPAFLIFGDCQVGRAVDGDGIIVP